MSNGALHDIYNTQAGLYMPPPQPSFGQNPLASQLHAMQPQAIDAYLLQGVSNPAMAGTHPTQFGGASFATMPTPFAGAMGGGMNDHYQRSGFAYGM